MSIKRESLQKASKEYYTSDTTTMSDAEYDLARREILAENPDDDIAAEVGSPEEDLAKVKHEIPMGSLDNCMNMQEFSDWAGKYSNQIFSVSWKVDGLSMSLKYKDGVLVDAVTRGNGIEGGRVMFSVSKIKGLAKLLVDDFTGYVRGEVYLPKTSLKEINLIKESREERKFANCRNAASGIVRNENTEFAKNLAFMAFDIADKEGNIMPETHTHKFNALDVMGFDTPYIKNVLFEMCDRLYSESIKNRESLNMDVDGLVVAINDIDVQIHLGIKDNRPVWSRALKFPAPLAHTRLKGVEFTMGHTGAIIPTAVLEPVEIAGTTVSHALLCNRDTVIQLGIKIGDMVVVSKRGDIIPKIERKADGFPATGNEVEILFPTVCPYCQTGVVEIGVSLCCPNVNCAERNIRKIISFVSKDKMNIMHMGEQAVRRLYAYGSVKNVKDLLQLTRRDLDNIFGVSGSKMFESLSTVKSKSPHEYIGSLGIEGCGKRRAKDIIAKLNVKSPQEFCNISAGSLMKLDGFQQTLAQKVSYQIAAFRDMICAMPSEVNWGMTTTAVENSKSVCFTGKVEICNSVGVRYTRDVLQGLAKNAGYDVRDSVSKDLDYLVQADANSTHSKSEKAKKFGVKIISDVEFLNMLGV